MPDFKLTDEELIFKFKEGNEDAFNELVYRYKDKLLNFIYRFISDIDRAEDLVQDTFIKLYLNKHSYREIARFSTWLYTIAGNLAKTELRKLKRRKTYSVSDLSYDNKKFEFENHLSSPIQNNEMIDKERTMQIALQKLPNDFKLVIILRDIQELSYEDISKIINIPLGTIKSRINRARLKLIEIINKGEK